MKEYIIKANVSGKLADECLNVLNASELVRCKDCKNGSIYCTEDTNGETLYECNIHGIYDIEIHKSDWFCADGEEKEA